MLGGIGVNPNSDPDGDGMSNKQEYLAGTNPTNSSDKLIITAFSKTGLAGNVGITWSSVLSRRYYIQKTTDLASHIWTDSGLGLISPTGAATTRSFADSATTNRYFRVEAVRPLAP